MQVDKSQDGQASNKIQEGCGYVLDSVGNNQDKRQKPGVCLGSSIEIVKERRGRTTASV